MSEIKKKQVFFRLSEVRIVQLEDFGFHNCLLMTTRITALSWVFFYSTLDFYLRKLAMTNNGTQNIVKTKYF